MIIFLKHIDIEGPGTMGEFFENAGFKIKIINLEAGENLPVSLDNLEAVVSLGGPMNVYEETKYPFLVGENQFLQRLLKENIPFLGICLGAQLLAKAAGACVGKSPEKEIGFFDVSLTEKGRDDILFQGIESIFTVFQWHEDSFDIPLKGFLLGKSERCPHQAFRVGKKAYGVQFHLEVTSNMIENWLRRYWKLGILDENQKAKDIIEEYDKMKANLNKGATVLYQNFLKIVRN